MLMVVPNRVKGLAQELAQSGQTVPARRGTPVCRVTMAVPIISAEFAGRLTPDDKTPVAIRIFFRSKRAAGR